MHKLFAIISIPIIFCSCNKLDGKIETRQQDKVYLVNTSTTKPIKFTVKATKITNDTAYDYYTDIIELPPGDEKYLGTKKEVSEMQYPIINKRIFKVLKGPVDSLTLFTNKRISFDEDGDPIPPSLIMDTVINGQKLKCYYINQETTDTLHPYQQIVKYLYEVTGQVEIKSKK